MELRLDLEEIVVRLADPSETSCISVRVVEPAGATPMSHSHRLGDVVAARHIGALEAGGEVVIDPAILRFLAAGEVDESWEADLEAMIDRAATKGWIDDHGRIRAHVEWPGSRP
ncbi:MAG: hypothetical protein WCI12_09555 [Actinomycetes bacterium]